ncbi:hypothetical protein EDB83DRAFT_2527077 [Lactarius deliciosus]|nr:hypothetical protein EDB83DRAFT_2527077 [Lactarius deliciosus]
MVTFTDVPVLSFCRLKRPGVHSPVQTYNSMASKQDVVYVPISPLSLPSLISMGQVLHEGLPAGRMRLYWRQTSEQGQRGFHLSSLGILLVCSLHPRPWRQWHVPALKALVRDLRPDSAAQGDSSQDVWEPARRFFELRKARLEDLGRAGAWHRRCEELIVELDMDDGGAQDGDGHLKGVSSYSD